MDFYDKIKKTIATSVDLVCGNEETESFPEEGVCIGTLNINNIQIPALLDFLSKGACFMYDSAQTKEIVNNCLEKIAWRLALSVPVQLAEFVVYNGGSAGENFISLEKLDKSLFKSANKVLFDGKSAEFTKILTEIYNDIPERRRVLYDWEKPNLYELNKSEGNDANIKYTFLFVSNFTNLNEEQKMWLTKISAANCAKSGIFVFISWDINYKIDDNYNKINYQDIFGNMTLLLLQDGRFWFKNSSDDSLRNKFIFNIDGGRIGKKEQEDLLSVLNKRIEKAVKSSTSVNIRELILTPELMWSKKSKDGIEIPIGNISSKELMNFELCRNDKTVVHGIVCGATGSGKSTLLHDIIINGAWLYSPDELQFVLLDFKSVEFGIYSKLPHVHVLSTQSDREYGANVLEYICNEIENRKKIFGNVSSIEEYNDDKRHVPRWLVIIDEFQNLFNDGMDKTMRSLYIKDRINRNFNKILKEGRSFGIHLLLATQQTDSIWAIESYLQQIKLRMVLQMLNKNALLSRNNKAQPEKLKRGEVIYNENLGNEDDNQFFRYTFYGNENITHKQVIEDELMIPINDKAAGSTNSQFVRYIYNGKGESVINSNTKVAHHIDNDKCVIYVGSPVTVRLDDISFELVRRRSFNVMIVAAGSDYLDSLLRLTFRQAIEQSSPESSFLICSSSNDSCNPDDWGLDKLKLYKDNEGLESVITTLGKHLEDRQNGNEPKTDRIVFALVGLRYFDAISPQTDLKKQLQKIVIEGPEIGIHTIVHSERFSDITKLFGADYMDASSIEPSDFIREFCVKIEMKSEDGEDLLSSDKNQSPQEIFLANIQTKENGLITKFSIYKQ